MKINEACAAAAVALLLCRLKIISDQEYLKLIDELQIRVFNEENEEYDALNKKSK